MLLPSGVFFLVPSLDLSLASCSVHGSDFPLSKWHQSTVALISGSSCWASAQSMTCICMLSLIDFTLTLMESASQLAAELALYSNSALLPAPEVKLLKAAFIASEDIVWGWPSLVTGLPPSLQRLQRLYHPLDHRDCFEHLSASSSERCSSLILLKASATTISGTSLAVTILATVVPFLIIMVWSLVL